MDGIAIALTGPSSAGKTSLGQALRRVLPRPTLFLDGDELDLPEDSEARRWLMTLPSPVVGGIEDDFHLGFYRALAGLASSGLIAVGEVLFKKPDHLDLFREATVGVRSVVIHVTCPHDLRVSRESRRGDRRPGTAVATAAQEWVPPHADLVIDTAVVSPTSAAAMVRSGLGFDVR